MLCILDVALVGKARGPLDLAFIDAYCGFPFHLSCLGKRCTFNMENCRVCTGRLLMESGISV